MGLTVYTYNGDSATALYIAALRSAANDDWAGALADIEAAIKHRPGNAYYHVARGLFLERQLHLPAEVKELLRGVPLDTARIDILAKARSSFERALSLNPLEDVAEHNLGWTYALSGSWNRAERHFLRAVTLDAADPAYLLSEATAMEHIASGDAAVTWFCRAVEIDPAVAESSVFERFTELYPVEARNVLAMASKTLNEMKGASPIASARYARLLMVLGEYGRAREVLYSVTSELPNMPKPWLNLGIMSAKDGDAQRALLFIRRASLLDPGDSESAYRLGLLYDLQGKYREGGDCFRRAAGLKRLSHHAARSSWIYKVSLVIADDIVPHGWLQQTSPSDYAAAARAKLKEGSGL